MSFFGYFHQCAQPSFRLRPILFYFLFLCVLVACVYRIFAAAAQCHACTRFIFYIFFSCRFSRTIRFSHRTKYVSCQPARLQWLAIVSLIKIEHPNVSGLGSSWMEMWKKSERERGTERMNVYAARYAYAWNVVRLLCHRIYQDYVIIIWHQLKRWFFILSAHATRQTARYVGFCVSALPMADDLSISRRKNRTINDSREIEY